MPGPFYQNRGQQSNTGLGPAKRKRGDVGVDEEIEVVDGNTAVQVSRSSKRRREAEPLGKNDEPEADVIVLQTSEGWQLATKKRNATMPDTNEKRSSKRCLTFMEYGAETGAGYTTISPLTNGHSVSQSSVSNQPEFMTTRNILDSEKGDYGNTSGQSIYQEYSNTSWKQSPSTINIQGIPTRSYQHPDHGPSGAVSKAYSENQNVSRGKNRHGRPTQRYRPPANSTDPALIREVVTPRYDSGTAYAVTSNANPIDPPKESRFVNRRPTVPSLAAIHTFQGAPTGLSSRSTIDKSRDRRLMSRFPVESGNQLTANGEKPTEGMATTREDSYTNTGTPTLYGDEAIDALMSILPPQDDLPLNNDPALDYQFAQTDAFVKSLIGDKLTNSGLYEQLPSEDPKISPTQLVSSVDAIKVRYQQGIAAEGKLQEEEDGLRGQNPALYATGSSTVNRLIAVPVEDEVHQLQQLPGDDFWSTESAGASTPGEDNI
ncbi:MAG: hypothetical protein Q9187_005802 [Circinaria calcarea]